MMDFKKLSKKRSVIMSACLLVPYKKVTGRELLNIRFDFSTVGGKLMIVDIYFAWFDNTNDAAVARYVKKGGDAIYSMYPYKGYKKNKNYRWHSIRGMKSISSTFGAQMAGVIKKKGGGEKGYKELLKAMDDYVVSERKRIKAKYKD